MKRFGSGYLPGLIATGLAFVFVGCAGAPAPPPAPTNANVAVAEATPDKAAIEAELTRLENDWPRIIKERDAAAVRRLEADDVYIIYPDGSVGNKEQDAKDIESGVLTADSWEITDLVVKVLDKDSAVVTLRNVVKGGKYHSSDGQTQNISGEYRSLDVFAKRDGQWQLVSASSVPIRNPSPSASATPTPKSSPTMKSTPEPRSSPAVRTATPRPPAPVSTP